MNTKKFVPYLATALLALPLANAQETSIATQMLVRAQSKANVALNAASVKLEIDSKATPLTSLTPVKPSGVQVALLIDDGLSRSVGIQLNDLKSFASTLMPGAELLVGYMSNGRILVASPFTTDRAASIAAMRLPFGTQGQSGSPYFCLSEFVKHWPEAGETSSQTRNSQETGASSSLHKARFVLMLTDGVDPYNGSVSITNQNSPYVESAISDAQRAGAAVSSIYYSDRGLQGEAASFSGQGYLQQVAEATGGEALYQGDFNPVSLKPFLSQFQHAIAETYIAAFPVRASESGRDHLVRINMSTSTPKLKLRHPEEVRPGNQESAPLS